MFVEPELVAEVAFREWTRARTLRAPVYKGLRPDKKPEEVVFETKPQIALSLVDRALEWGVPFRFVVADAGYGDNPSFLQGLEKREVAYVCAIEIGLTQEPSERWGS